MPSSISPIAGSQLAPQITAAHPPQTGAVDLRSIQEFGEAPETFVLCEGKLKNKPAFVLQPPSGGPILLTGFNGQPLTNLTEALEKAQQLLPPQATPSVNLPAAPGFLLVPGGNPKMHQDIKALQPPNTREKYDTPLQHKPEVLQEIARDGQWIAQIARLRYPLAGALLLHYFQGSGSARQINISRDLRGIGDTYGDLREKNIKVAQEFFKENPGQDTITIRSPWMPSTYSELTLPATAMSLNLDRSNEVTIALNSFYISTVSTFTAVKDTSGKIIGLRERSTGVISDYYDFSEIGKSLTTPLGDISREHLHAMGHPAAHAAKGFQVYGFDTLTNPTSMIPWTP